jgi:hypothetical protein
MGLFGPMAGPRPNQPPWPRPAHELASPPGGGIKRVPHFSLLRLAAALRCRWLPPAALAGAAVRGQAPHATRLDLAPLFFFLVLSHVGVGYDLSSDDRVGVG